MSLSTALVIALQALILLSLWIFFVQLLKQRGRILLRLDALESREHKASEDSEADVPQPVHPGQAFPDLRLPDLSGKEVSLSDFSPHSILLVHWGPHCSFCGQIAGELGSLQVPLLKQGIQTVLLAHGDEEDNQRLLTEHNLICPVLMQTGSPPVKAFRGLGTPSAYLLAPNRNVSEPVAIGAADVMELARAYAPMARAAAASMTPGRDPVNGNLAKSNIEREGLQPGSDAPVITSTDILTNEAVDTGKWKGSRSVVVFSDPHCGPCEYLAQLIPGLKKQLSASGAQFLFVGRGDREENRRKAEQFRIASPVVVQNRWEISRRFGIFATPVAFLIDENGRIARPVARGVEEIQTLIRTM